MDIFQHKDIMRIYPDLITRSLVSWNEKGVITPDHEDAKGRGTARKYSFDNVIQIGIIRELARFGLTFKDIKICLNDWIKEQIRQREYACFLICSSKMESRVCGWEPNVFNLGGIKGAAIINVSEIYSRVIGATKGWRQRN